MKRVLIVYHSFDEWEMGPIRLRRIARNLAQHGYEPVVLTSPVSSRSSATPPPGLEILRAKAVDLGDVYGRWFRRGAAPTASAPTPDTKTRPRQRAIGFTSGLNRWLMVPDKQMTWKGPAVRLGQDYLKQHGADVIFASLPPRSNVLVGARLSRLLGIPCVLEFRDLWTGSPYAHMTQPTALHRLVHERLERSAIQSAARVTSVCRGIADYLSEKYRAALAAPVELNYNFYDPSEYPTVERQGDGPFILSYVGAMYASRNPLAFFEGLKLFLTRHKVPAGAFRFRWVGSVLGVPGLEESLATLGLDAYIDYVGQLPHEAALRELCGSDASLLIQSPADTIHIPGKLFEAMGAGVPLLALSHPCEVTEIIERTHAGLVASYEAPAIAAALEQLWTWRSARQPWPYLEAARSHYTAASAVGRLAALFDHAVASCPSPHT